MSSIVVVVVGGADRAREVTNEAAELGATVEIIDERDDVAEKLTDIIERTADPGAGIDVAELIHDLKNPLGALSGFVRLLRDRRDRLTPEQIVTAIEGMDSSVHKLSEIVSELAEPRETPGD